MRLFVLMAAFVLACGHPAAVPAPAGPAPAPTPKPASAPDLCAAETGPADAILRTFRAELLAAASADPSGFAETAQARAAAFQREQRTVLAAHAAWSLRRLPTLALPGLDTLPDEPRLTAAMAARMGGIVDADAAPGDSPLRAYLDLLATDPIRAFAGIRAAVISSGQDAADLPRVHENVLEGLAPPRLVRTNADFDHPVLALPKRADVFVVWFDRDEGKGSYRPSRIRWVRRDPPAEPSPTVTSAEDALSSFATAVEALMPGEGDTVANIAARALERVRPLAAEWLDPHASLLRAHATCACKKIPRASLPDLSGWKEADNLSALVGVTPRFPRLRWDPVQAFLFLRSTIDARTMSVGDYSGLALVDSLVPPSVARANDDANAPVLFLAEGDTALVVDFSSTPELGFFPTKIRHLRRP